LLPTIAVSVCLSRGSTHPHGAKTVERIKILFEVNTLGGPWNIVLGGGPDPPQRGGGEVGENLFNCGPTTYLKNVRKQTLEILRGVGWGP